MGGGPRRDLRCGSDVGFFPTVDDIPRLTKQRSEPCAVQHRVHLRGEMTGHRLQRAGLVWFRARRMHAEITAEPRRRDNGDVPAARACQLVCQPAIGANAVRSGQS